MKTRSLAVLLAVAALLAPAAAFAGALGEAKVAGQNPGAYDGARVRQEGSPVSAGSTGDNRTPEQVAAAARGRAAEPVGRPALTAPVPGPDAENKEPVKKPWFTWPLAIRGIIGALVGLVIGSLFGPVGLVAGPLIGAALFYGVSKYSADKAADEAAAS